MKGLLNLTEICSNKAIKNKKYIQVKKNNHLHIHCTLYTLNKKESINLILRNCSE